MRLKYCTLAGSYLLGALLTASSYAETPAPKVGYIRFWDMLPPANGVFEVRKAGVPASERGLLSGTAYQYSSYTQFPPGRYQLAVSKKGAADLLIKVVDIDLKPDTYFTIIVSPQSGAIGVEVVDDTKDPKAAAGTLTVRNYFTGLTVAVSTDTQKIVDAVPYGQTYAATGLPLSRVPLTLRTRLPNGVPAESSAEADFKTSPRATLLIIPDSYGRFRPRVTADGTNQ